eukprot:3528753-Alexandrium_andersonii.AAC.1
MQIGCVVTGPSSDAPKRGQSQDQSLNSCSNCCLNSCFSSLPPGAVEVEPLRLPAAQGDTQTVVGPSDNLRVREENDVDQLY